MKHGKLDVHDLGILKILRSEGFEIFLCSSEIQDSILADYWFRKGTRGRDSSVLQDVARSYRRSDAAQIEFSFLNDSMMWGSYFPKSVAETSSQVRNFYGLGRDFGALIPTKGD